jgi:phosphopantetheine--protein transferase-like protein
MIYGVGVDIIDPKRIERTLAPDDAFVLRAFTEKERAFAPCDERARIDWYAGCFAVKEAVFKALRDDSFRARAEEIETLREANGSPFVTLYGRTKERAAQAGVTAIHVSLAKEDGLVCAFAVAVAEEGSVGASGEI